MPQATAPGFYMGAEGWTQALSGKRLPRRVLSPDLLFIFSNGEMSVWGKSSEPHNVEETQRGRCMRVGQRGSTDEAESQGTTKIRERPGTDSLEDSRFQGSTT